MSIDDTMRRISAELEQAKAHVERLLRQAFAEREAALDRRARILDERDARLADVPNALDADLKRLRRDLDEAETEQERADLRAFIRGMEAARDTLRSAYHR